MDRKVVGMSNYLSIYPSICLSICFVCLSAYLSIVSFSIHVSIIIYLSTYPSSCLTTYPLSVYLPIHLSVFPSICLALYLSTQPSINQTACLVYLSFFLSFYFSLLRSIHFLVYLSVFPLVFRSIQILFKCPTPAIVLGNARQPPPFSHFWPGAQSLAPATRPRETTSERPKVLRACQLLHFWLGDVLRATTACTFSTSQLPKVLRPWCVLYLLIWKCASCHNGVHFFDISTSKSAPTLVCFVHFGLDMCIVPQRRALFRHLNFQKCSNPGVFCAFWLGNALRATTVCTFSTSSLPKVVWRWCALYILTWKCAWRHNGVQFFISHLATWLRTRRFSEPTFRSSGATNHWKKIVFRDFPAFSRTWIFFLLRLSLFWSSLFFSSPLWLFPPLLFHLSILSEVWLLNFLRLPLQLFDIICCDHWLLSFLISHH